MHLPGPALQHPSADAGPALRSFARFGSPVAPVAGNKQSIERLTRIADLDVVSCCRASSSSSCTSLKPTKHLTKLELPLRPPKSNQAGHPLATHPAVPQDNRCSSGNVTRSIRMICGRQHKSFRHTLRLPPHTVCQGNQMKLLFITLMTILYCCFFIVFLIIFCFDYDY